MFSDLPPLQWEVSDFQSSGARIHKLRLMDVQILFLRDCMCVFSPVWPISNNVESMWRNRWQSQASNKKEKNNREQLRRRDMWQSLRSRVKPSMSRAVNPRSAIGTGNQAWCVHWRKNETIHWASCFPQVGVTESLSAKKFELTSRLWSGRLKGGAALANRKQGFC